MRRSPLLPLVLLVAAASRGAAAAPREETTQADPPVAIALAAGAATAFLPLALGVMHTANAPVYAYGLRNVGYIVAGAGIAIAPIVSHVIVGEYKRAAAFGAAPVAAQIAMIALVTAEPWAVFSGTKGSRTTFGLLFAVDAFGAAIGLIDVALARDRANKRASLLPGGITIAPAIGGGNVGIAVGGTL